MKTRYVLPTIVFPTLLLLVCGAWLIRSSVSGKRKIPQSRNMNETDKYILDSIKTWVWSGFYTQDEVQEMISDILEDDADENSLRSAVAPEFARKSAVQKTWPKETDCDRLDRAFDALNAQGIIALHNAGMTMSDGHSDVAEVLHQRGRTRVKGYCFYHGQDLERAVAGDGLMIAFGDLDDDPSAKVAVGSTVKAGLEKYGFSVEWNGDPEQRINIPDIDWKRRRRPKY